MDMGIAASSVNMSYAKVSQQLDIATMKMAMRDKTEGVAELLNSVAVAQQTGVGRNVDIQA